MKKDKAYVFIKKRILNRTWDVGSTINVNEVCTVLDMSRTPVQEAISRLEREGFLSIIPQVGAFVRRPTPKELFERLLLRSALEALTAEWAAQKVDKIQLDILDSILRKMENPDISMDHYASLNKDFHRTIHEVSGLTYVQDLVEKDWNFFEYAAATESLFQDDRMQRSYLEHRMIFFSLEDRNGSLAKQLMEQHIVRAANIIRHEGKLASNVLHIER